MATTVGPDSKFPASIFTASVFDGTNWQKYDMEIRAAVAPMPTVLGLLDGMPPPCL